jgi:predicted nuclease of restriction endonuclease-like (RecB) superfamily
VPERASAAALLLIVQAQAKVEIGGQDLFLDLLSYYLRLRCYIVIDLKIEEFKPEFAGKSDSKNFKGHYRRF